VGFEDVASGPALQARAGELIASGRPSSLTAQYGVADIFVAARQGDQVGRQVVDELIGHVAAVIAGATALVDPERIILDGSIGRAIEPWLDDLRSSVAAGVFRAPDILVSALGPNATVLGAIARALAIVAERDEPSVGRPLSGG
jgi:glucokinase